MGTKILRVNPYILWGILITLVLLKSGFRSASLGVSINFVPALAEMPNATNLFQSGFGPFWLAYILGIDSTRAWLFMTSFILLIALILVVPLAKSRFPGNVQLGIIILGSLSVMSTQFSWLGMYDPFIFLGLIIWGLGRSRFAWIAGGLIASSANPEQVTVAAILAVIATFVMGLRAQRKQALFLLATAIIAVGISQVWFFLSDNSLQRASQLGELLEPSLYAFTKFWPLYLWAIFGALWLIVLLTVVSLRSKLVAVLSTIILIGMPLVAAALTLDGSRVIALVALPITLIITGFFIDSMKSYETVAPYVAIGLLALLIFAPPTELGWPAIGPLVYDFMTGIT